MDAIDHAESAFRQGYNCSQAVLIALVQPPGLDRDTALRLASGFGGGVGRSGQICGAAAAAVRAIGLARGHSTPERPAKERTYQLVHEFLQRFQKEHGALTCLELLGCDISTPAGFLAAKPRHDQICPQLVRNAVRIAASLIAASNAPASSP